MDFWDLTKVVFRRWYVGLPVLILTAAICVFTWNSSTPDYTQTAYVQLVGPTASVNSNGQVTERVVNPWLDLGLDSLNSAAVLVTEDATFIKGLKDAGYTDNVAVTPAYPNPVVTIVVIGDSQQQAIHTTELVVQRYETSVEQLQRNRAVNDHSMITSLRLDNGNNIEVSTGKIKRAVIAVAAAGLLVMVGATMSFDTLVRRRKRRRATGDESLSGPEPLRPTEAPRRGSVLPDVSPAVVIPPPSSPGNGGVTISRSSRGEAIYHTNVDPTSDTGQLPAVTTTAPRVPRSEQAPLSVEYTTREADSESSSDRVTATDSTVVLPLSFSRNGRTDGDRPRP